MVEPFRIHIADDVLDDLRARLRHTRWPEQIPGIGWDHLVPSLRCLPPRAG